MTVLSIGRLGFEPCDEWIESFVSIVMPILKSSDWRGSQEWTGIIKGLRQIGFRRRLKSKLDQDHRAVTSVE